MPSTKSPAKAPDIKIDREFKTLIPAPTEEELKQLEANLLKDGCRDPLVIWKEENILVDGHTRMKLCSKHDIAHRLVFKSFKDRREVKNWIILNQIGRRNLDPQQRKVLIGRLYNEAKQDHGGQRPGSGPKPSGEQKPPENKGNNSSGQNVHLNSGSSKTVAQQAGVDEKTVRRAGKYAEAVEQLATPVKEVITTGEVKADQKTIEALAQYDATSQKMLVNQVKKGEVKSLKEAIAEQEGEKPKPSRGKEISPAKLVDELLKKHYGYIVRGVSEIAKINGKGEYYKQANDALEELIQALKKMREGKK